MSVTIERNEITRLTEIEFPDGKDIVGEGLEYISSCGCRVVYGIRWKGGLNEKCSLIYPCDKHPKLGENINAISQPGHIMYDEDVDKAVSWAILFAEADK